MVVAENGEYVSATEIDTMFTGEESNGRFFDLTRCHEEYLNLPGVKKRTTYLQYLGLFDKFDRFARGQKTTDRYLVYVNALTEYLESFLARTRPLQDPEGIVKGIEADFDKAWEEDSVPGWGKLAAGAGPEVGPRQEQAVKEEFWCAVCAKGFANKNVYEHHFASKKHKREAAKAEANGGVGEEGEQREGQEGLVRLKDKVIAEREWRVVKMTELMKTEREGTLTNVERKQSLTERERRVRPHYPIAYIRVCFQV